jgi:ribose transport system ATP-binding protein
VQQSALLIEGLGKSFGATAALDGVSLRIGAGEIHGVLGQNGAGKSTLVKILTGVYPYGTYAGSFEVGGTKVRFSSPHDARAARVGYVPQEIEVFDNLEVAENVLAGHLSDGVRFSRSEARRRSQTIFDRLGVSMDPTRRVGDLSPAQRQMVMIGRALAIDPQVLILDEPTTSLSETEAERLCDVVLALARQGLSIVFITHRVREVMQICNRVTILRDGRVAESMERDRFSEEAIVAGMAGREIRELYPGRAYAPGDVVLAAHGITTRPTAAGGTPVRGVSILLHGGEILGIAGVLGSGRTELLQALFGQIHRSGEVTVVGRNVRAGDPGSARKAGIEFLTEDRKSQGLLFNLPVYRNVTLGNLSRVSTFGVISRRRERVVAADVVQRLSVKVPDLSAAVTHLSGGNQQKLLLGRCLLSSPRVILLDEPTKGVDVGTRQQIYGHIARLSQGGTGVIVVSSELDELLGMCDRLVVLASGQVVDEFLRGEGDESRILEATASARLREGAQA